MPDIYQGPDSCYARREGRYVRGRGVSLRNVRQYIKFILRDLRRGWTYNRSCRRIRMTPELAEKRLRFLVKLARKHGASDWEVARIKTLVERALRRVARMVSA